MNSTDATGDSVKVARAIESRTHIVFPSAAVTTVLRQVRCVWFEGHVLWEAGEAGWNRPKYYVEFYAMKPK